MRWVREKRWLAETRCEGRQSHAEYDDPRGVGQGDCQEAHDGREAWDCDAEIRVVGEKWREAFDDERRDNVGEENRASAHRRTLAAEDRRRSEEFLLKF